LLGQTGQDNFTHNTTKPIQCVVYSLVRQRCQ